MQVLAGWLAGWLAGTMNALADRSRLQVRRRRRDSGTAAVLKIHVECANAFQIRQFFSSDFEYRVWGDLKPF